MRRRILWLGLLAVGICQVVPAAERTLAVSVSQTVLLKPEFAILKVALSTAQFKSPDEVGTKLGSVLPDIAFTSLTSGSDCTGTNRIVDTYTFSVRTPFPQLSASLQRLDAARADLTTNFGLTSLTYQVERVSASQDQFAAQEAVVRPALEAAARVEAQALAQLAGLALGPAVFHSDSMLQGYFINPTANFFTGDYSSCGSYASYTSLVPILSSSLADLGNLSGLSAQYQLSVEYQVN